MTDTLSFLRANPALLAMGGLLLAGALVFGGFAILMARSGASTRPIIFVGGFFLLVVAPQALFHLSQAMGWIPRRDLTWTPAGTVSTPGSLSASAAMAREAANALRIRTDVLAIRDGRFADPVAVFGPTVDRDLVVDLRQRMPGGPFDRAKVAEMAIVGAGSSTVVARFDEETDAEAAAMAYIATMVGEVPPLGMDGTRTVARASDVLKVLVRDATVIAWSAADSAAVNRAFLGSALVVRGSTGLPEEEASSVDADAEAASFWLYRPLVAGALLVGMMLVVCTWFFRMATWAGETPAVAGVPPAPVHSLRERLLALNTIDAPYTVAPVEGDSRRLMVTWRYADAKWVDLARARGMRRTHRVLLRFDESANTVRPVEQMSRLDWSAGAGGGSVDWKREMGITFFQVERHRNFGVQLDERGRPTGGLSYEYRFDVRDLKGPLIRIATEAGWNWRPTLLEGPAWLRWMTGA
ncbi:MAG TPA: hypothetical protein VE869_06110 [Gemmatimonas sp.]|nr:hypothetical protein [Gemmatimonas sp.]